MNSSRDNGISSLFTKGNPFQASERLPKSFYCPSPSKKLSRKEKQTHIGSSVVLENDRTTLNVQKTSRVPLSDSDGEEQAEEPFNPASTVFRFRTGNVEARTSATNVTENSSMSLETSLEAKSQSLEDITEKANQLLFAVDRLKVTTTSATAAAVLSSTSTAGSSTPELCCESHSEVHSQIHSNMCSEIHPKVNAGEHHRSGVLAGTQPLPSQTTSHSSEVTYSTHASKGSKGVVGDSLLSSTPPSVSWSSSSVRSDCYPVGTSSHNLYGVSWNSSQLSAYSTSPPSLADSTLPVDRPEVNKSERDFGASSHRPQLGMCIQPNITTAVNDVDPASYVLDDSGGGDILQQWRLARRLAQARNQPMSSSKMEFATHVPGPPRVPAPHPMTGSQHVPGAQSVPGAREAASSLLPEATVCTTHPPAPAYAHGSANGPPIVPGPQYTHVPPHAHGAQESSRSRPLRTCVGTQTPQSRGKPSSTRTTKVQYVCCVPRRAHGSENLESSDWDTSTVSDSEVHYRVKAAPREVPTTMKGQRSKCGRNCEGPLRSKSLPGRSKDSSAIQQRKGREKQVLQDSLVREVVCSKLFVPVDPASSKHMQSSYREHRRSKEAPQRRSKKRISCTQQSNVTELGTEEVEGPPVAEKTPVVELSWDDDMNDDILKMLIARATFYEKAIRIIDGILMDQ